MRRIFTLFLLMFSFLLVAQNPEQLIKEYYIKKAKSLNLLATDITNLKIVSSTQLSDPNFTVFYAQQHFKNIKIDNALATVTVTKNNVVSSSESLIDNLSKKIETVNVKNQPSQILNQVLVHKGFSASANYKIEDMGDSSYKIILQKNPLQPLYMDLVYIKSTPSSYKLAWKVELFDAEFKELSVVYVEDSSSKIIKDQPLTLTCGHKEHHQNNPTLFKKDFFWEKNVSAAPNAQYLVYDYKKQWNSANQRELIVNPSDPNTSPYGWHNINTDSGIEFTTTKGNNVYAYEDINALNEEGTFAEGGSTLNFSFPYTSPEQDFTTYTQASVTNLFYVSNSVHDLLYRFGFDENSGNFQYNQFGKNKDSKYAGADPLLAEAQDGSGLNNANISVPRDGASPRMQMYMWRNSGLQPLRITDPLDIAGYYTANESVFEPGFVALPTRPNVLNQAVVLAQSTNNEACDVITNATELQGKIALIKRGNCGFTDKVLAAQNAGAVAVIIMNNDPEGGLVNMSGEDDRITIPALFISFETGSLMLDKLQNNQSVFVELAKDENTARYDGSFDSTIIVHEIGHGLSVRLTGGKQSATCLQSAEQMGEGWSDFLALMVQVKDSDSGEMPKGIGSFALGANDASATIREYPYSTNLSVNPLTYGATNEFYYESNGITRVNFHKVGTVWASMLWDMAWALMDAYGIDENLRNPNAGNVKALQLVINALKLQPCNPSFVTGRNAIFEADRLLYGGENACLLWEVFAKRGLGLYAKAGLNETAEDIKDQVEDFTKPESCLQPNAFNVSNPKVFIFPNPTKNELYVSIPQYTNPIHANIFDIHGRLVATNYFENFEQITRIKTYNLATGVYIIKLEGKNLNQSVKFIKQ